MANTLPNPEARRNWPSWVWLLLGGLALAAVLAIIWESFWGSIHWDYQSYKTLFYEKLGFSDATSTFWAYFLAFFYPFTSLPLVLAAYRWKWTARTFSITFAAYLLVYCMQPFLMAVLGDRVCFNQANGKVMKWYARAPDGSLEFYSDPGYTPFGAVKQPVTPDICPNASARPPKLVAADPLTIQYFDGRTSLAKIWYDTGPDGSWQLFDTPGHDPITDAELQAVTPDIVTKIRADALRKKRDAQATIDRYKEEQKRKVDEAERLAAAEVREKEKLADADAREKQRRWSMHCAADTPCSLSLSAADSSVTVPVDVPMGKTACFDRTFWTNLDQLGFETSYRHSGFSAFACSMDEVKAHTCAAKQSDTFRFRPEPSAELPHYWFVSADSPRC